MNPTTGKRLAIRLARLTAAVLCAAVLSNGPATAQGMLAQGKISALGTILRQMIVRNPDIVARRDALLNDPASPVGDTQVPGAVDVDTLKTLIARARQRGTSGKVQ